MAAPDLPLDNVESNEDVDRVEVCSTVTELSLGASATGTHQAFLLSTAAFQSWSPAPQAAARGSSPQQPFSSDHNETAASALVDGCGQGQQAFLLSTAAPPFQFGSPAPQAAARGSSPQQPFSSDHNETAASALVDGWGQGQPSENATRKRGHRRRKGRKERRKQKQQMRAAHSAAGSHSDGAAPQQTSDDGSFIKVDIEVEGELTKAYVDEQIRRRDEAIAHLSKQMEAMRPALEQRSTLKQELDGAKSQIKQLRSEQSRLQDTARAGMAKLEALKGADADMEKMRVALNQLKRDKDELAAELADAQGSMQKHHAETANEILQMKTGSDVGYEQLSKQTGDLKHTVAQLTDEQGTARAAVQDVADEVKALKERMEAMQSMALQSMATREEVEKHFGQLKLDKDATIERLSAVTGTLDAAVKDAVSAAMKDGPERELERVQASLKELTSPHALLQSPPKTVHAFDVFAHLKVLDGNLTLCGNVCQRPITVTLVRGSDASSLASAVAPSCKFCAENYGKCWVDDRKALRQCVTSLLASHGAAGGPEQRWAYVTWYPMDNLSCIHPQDLEKRKPLPPGSCESWVLSVEWFQAWLRSCSPHQAITDADVKSPKLSN